MTYNAIDGILKWFFVTILLDYSFTTLIAFLMVVSDTPNS
jgi:hypothetical protein